MSDKVSTNDVLLRVLVILLLVFLLTIMFGVVADEVQQRLTRIEEQCR